MSLQYQDFVFRDFSQGISDNYVNIPLNRYEIGDNVYIKEDGSYETRYGSTPFYDAEVSSRISALMELNGDIFFYRLNAFFQLDTDNATISNPTRPNIGTPTYENNFGYFNLSWEEWQDHLIVHHSGSETGELNRGVKIYKDDVGNYRLNQLGMPEMTTYQLTSITFTQNGQNLQSTGQYDPLTQFPAAGTWTYRYVYNFVFTVEYEEGTNTRKVFGPATQTNIIYTNLPINTNANNQMVISNLPVISNTGNQYDTVRMRLEVYRNDGATPNYFRVAELTNGQTTFTDQVPNENLVFGGIPLYTSGGVLDRYQAPKAKVVRVINNTPYWGYVADETSGEIKPYRVIQGFAGIIDSHAPSSFIDLDEEVVGIHGVNSFPIIFTTSRVYRLEGSFDNTGGGSIRARTISETAGCASNNGIITARDNLYWLGDNAVYVTNGYTVEKLPTTVDLLDTIRSFTDTLEKRRTVVATYDDDEDRIFWATNDTGGDNNRWLVLNLSTGGLTTASGDGFVSSALLFDEKTLYRGDELGYIYKHTENDASDPIRDENKPITEWSNRHIPWRYKSVQIDFGDPSITNWVSTISTKVSSETNYGILVTTDNDDGRVVRSCKEIRSWGNFFWDDPSFVWGDDEIVWSKSETITHKRHVPRGTSRSKARQIIMEPAEIIVYKSDTYGLATLSYVDPNNPTQVNVTLDNGGDWMADFSDYKISFETDGYAKQYAITPVNTTTIRVSGATPQNGVKWQITGKYKDARVNIKSYTLRAANIENEGREYTSGGGNDV